jgi:hypothetical protein
MGRKAVGCECMHFRMMRCRVALSLPDDTCPLSPHVVVEIALAR